MQSFRCPYLSGEVGLSDEREAHIVERHPELAGGYGGRIAQTLERPDLVTRSHREPQGEGAQARLFCRWYDDPYRRKYLVVVVVTDPPPAERHWIVTAYRSRSAPQGEVLWTSS